MTSHKITYRRITECCILIMLFVPASAVLRASPLQLQYSLQKANEECERGLEALRQNNYETAAQYFIRSIRSYPVYPAPYFGLAECYARQGRYDKAVEKLQIYVAKVADDSLSRVPEAKQEMRKLIEYYNACDQERISLAKNAIRRFLPLPTIDRQAMRTFMQDNSRRLQSRMDEYNRIIEFIAEVYDSNDREVHQSLCKRYGFPRSVWQEFANLIGESKPTNPWIRIEEVIVDATSKGSRITIIGDIEDTDGLSDVWILGRAEPITRGTRRVPIQFSNLVAVDGSARLSIDAYDTKGNKSARLIDLQSLEAKLTRAVDTLVAQAKRRSDISNSASTGLIGIFPIEAISDLATTEGPVTLTNLGASLGVSIESVLIKNDYLRVFPRGRLPLDVLQKEIAFRMSGLGSDGPLPEIPGLDYLLYGTYEITGYKVTVYLTLMRYQNAEMVASERLAINDYDFPGVEIGF